MTAAASFHLGYYSPLLTLDPPARVVAFLHPHLCLDGRHSSVNVQSPMVADPHEFEVVEAIICATLVDVVEFVAAWDRAEVLFIKPDVMSHKCHAVGRDDVAVTVFEG